MYSRHVLPAKVNLLRSFNQYSTRAINNKPLTTGNHNFARLKLGKITKLPSSFWKSHDNIRQYAQFLALQLGGSDSKQALHKLYDLTSDLIRATGGSGLLRYVGSPAAMAQIAFPDHDWKPWKFNSSPRGYWQCLGSRLRERNPDAICEMRDYLEELYSQVFGCKVQSNEPMDLNRWYSVTKELLGSTAYQRLAAIGMPLRDVLKLCYPNHPWDDSKWQQSYQPVICGFRCNQANQYILSVHVADLLPLESRNVATEHH